MSITSIKFLIFVLATIIIYYIANKKFAKYQWIILLIASYVFYAFFGYKYFVFILITTASTYLSARLIEKEQDACTEAISAAEQEDKRGISLKSKKKRKRYLVATLVLNFGILIFFKYFDIAKNGLFLATGNEAFNVTEGLILPLGISFYMFQSTGYMIDVYWGKYKSQKNFFKFALFVSFFPQIIQGPISKYKDLGPQLFSGHKWNDDSVKEGIYLILIGLFKKLIIADRLSVLVTGIMRSHYSYSGSIIFVTMLIYSVQIYCDFSGGIGVITGVAKLFSINLTPNFNRPFFATSLNDFWRRWHITLGTWMRDYVFYPLSLSKRLAKINRKSRKRFGPKLGKAVTISISSLIVYILVGLWHGPSLKYVVFGIYHGGLISLALATEDFVKKIQDKLHINVKSLWWHTVQVGVTIVLVTFGRYFSRADSLMQALSMFKRTLLNFQLRTINDGIFLKFELTKSDLILVGISIAVLFIVELLQEFGINIRQKFEKCPAIIQFTCLFIFMCGLTYYGFYAQGELPTEFIYMQY